MLRTPPRRDGRGTPWFVVLPDSEPAVAATVALRQRAQRVVLHASGRPWIVGDWAADEVASWTSRGGRLVLIGSCPGAERRLGRLAARARDLSAFDQASSLIDGSFHLVAEVGGRVRVQGSLSSLRRVYHTTAAGARIAGSRADVLAAAVDARLDERWLAARLLYGARPHPLWLASPWREVSPLAPDSCLVLDGHGRGATRRWWSPQEPTLPLAQGAAALRDALVGAVTSRVGGWPELQRVSCDLSGGLDSTALCWIATRTRADLLAVTVTGMDPANDDAVWADAAARSMPGLERLVLGPDDGPGQYAGLRDSGGVLDEPFSGVRGQAELAHLAELLAGAGSGLHLTGHGGDEVLAAGPGYLHTAARASPLTAIGHARGMRALFGWDRSAIVRAVADRRSYRRWLTDSVDLLTAPPPPIAGPSGWTAPFRLPPWATPLAAELVRQLVREMDPLVGPLAPSRGQHEALELIRLAGMTSRQIEQIMASAGLRVAFPFLDDKVVQACLPVRLHERTTPWRYKPLLSSAMHGVVPARLLQRSTKAETSTEAAAGLRRRRGDLLELAADSALVELGLVDREGLRRAIALPLPPDLPAAALCETLACEAWLRAHRRQPLPTAVLGAGHGV
jgi:asparagine synthase (glutamine-hydrolysing)